MTRSIYYKYNVITRSFSLIVVELMIKMFRLQSIGIALLVVVEVHHYCSTDTALETILDFLELHFTHCKESNRTLRRGEESCCQTCPCEKECESDDTCCPDFLLQKVIDKNPFCDAPSVRNDAHHITNTTILGITNGFQQFEYNDMYNCVDYRLRCGETNFEIPKFTTAYEMIAMCPNSYSAHTSIKHLCEVSLHEYQESMVDYYSSNLEELVSVFTPVTSLKTNITYRNIFCWACSEDNISENEYISWQAFVMCGHYKVSFPKDTPYELFYYITKNVNNYHNCNIIMKPPKVTENLTPKKCTPSDFKSCPLGTDAHLALLCRSFNLPVKQYTDLEHFKIYGNIACYLCNQNKPFVKTCSTTSWRIVEPFFETGLNLRMTAGLLSAYLSPNTSNVDSIKNENSSESINKYAWNSSYRDEKFTPGQEEVAISKLEDMKKLSSSYCNNNTDSKTCGDIMCPLYFYESDGECIPTFTSFGGMYFSICLEIKPAQSQQLNIVLPVLTHNLESVARFVFNNYSLEIWFSTEEEEEKIIVVIINIISTDPDFISTMNTLDFFLQNITDIRFQTEQGIFDIAFKLTTEDDYIFVGVKKFQTGKKVEAYRRERNLAISLKKMNIPYTMGCYRIEILEKNIALRNFDYKNKQLIPFERDINDKTGITLKYISCIADAIQISLRKTETYMFKGFAGKSSSPVDNPQEKEAIFIKNNASKDNIGTSKRIEDTVSAFAFGVRDGNLTVAAVVAFAVILLTMLTN